MPALALGLLMACRSWRSWLSVSGGLSMCSVQWGDGGLGTGSGIALSTPQMCRNSLGGLPPPTALCMRSLNWHHRMHRAHRPGSWRGWQAPGTVWCGPRAISSPAPGGGGIQDEEGDPWTQRKQKYTEKKMETKTEGTHGGNGFGRVFCHNSLWEERLRCGEKFNSL